MDGAGLRWVHGLVTPIHICGTINCITYCSGVIAQAYFSKCLLEYLKMGLNTTIDLNEILDTALGDDSDADIELGYEKNVYNEVSG